MIEQIYDIENLLKSFNLVRKISGWKTQTQHYEENYIARLHGLSETLKRGEYEPKKPNVFVLNERGKTRLIESYSIEDRIVQGCLVNSVLLPQVRPYLIYDNAASLKLRGTEFFRKRLEMHLKHFAKDYGNNGYILLLDYRKFFDNIWHSTFYDALTRFGVDAPTMQLVRRIVSEHEVDVSYMSGIEYTNCMNSVHDALWYYKNIPESAKTGLKMMPKSFGIGSQIAQLAGIASPYRIDNYIKIVQGCKHYGRYMDDSYIIHPDKDYLRWLAGEIDRQGKAQGFILNPRKTQIVNLKHEFTLLKTRYRLCADGRMIKIPDNSTFKRERRKIKAMKHKGVPKDLALAQYKSWIGGITARHGKYRSVRSIDEYFGKYY